VDISILGQPEGRIDQIVLIVIFGHDVCFNNQRVIGVTLDSLPSLGVKVFFAISGYLITQLFLSELRKTG
jgi:peptidoglycan/LPS O-acetylase OafA/YrhL